MAGLLLFVFLVLPIAEIYVAFRVADAIGAAATVLLLLGTSALGGMVVRRAGARAWASLQRAAAAGRPPRDVVDGAIVLLGGLLLLVPGFITDAAGVLLLIPLTRRLTRRLVTGYAGRRLRVPRGPGVRRPPADVVIDGEVVEGEVVDEPGPSPKSTRPGQIGRAG